MSALKSPPRFREHQFDKRTIAAAVEPCNMPVFLREHLPCQKMFQND